MLLTIKRFTVISIAILLSIFSTIFFYHFHNQENKLASVILKTINNTLSETSYTLSKNITNKNDTISSRPLLDRVASNHDFIKAILIIDDGNVLVTSDPHYSEAILTNTLYNNSETEYKKLIEREAIEGEIRFYEGNKAKVLKIQFLLDQEEISLHFTENRVEIFISFVLIPIVILLITWLLMRHLITKPLEVLRQFAYYQNFIPKPFNIREIEVIRHSMVQTFSRLDLEKKELYKMARTDSLSGLANRNSLNEYLARIIEECKRDENEFALLFVDLDNFKNVNDELGHNIGDELLQNVSSTIGKVMRKSDFIARVGGDEFIIVLNRYKSLTELMNIIDRIKNFLDSQWLVNTNTINITSSIGIAIFPDNGKDIVSLMKNADIAMFEAKKNGKAQCHFFTEELNSKVQETILMDKQMRIALANNEYELHYQPKVDITTGRIVGAEALIRWISPTKGMIYPNQYIHIAEENGFIVELGEWVLQEAIYQQTTWMEAGLDIPISINVGSKQLTDENFETKFLKLLSESKVDTSKIDLEITEYLFLEHNQNNLEVLNTIHNSGVTISLDDFGTGYSSLSSLKKFPIDNLKIDKSFIDDMYNKEGLVFVETIIKMGQTLNMKVIAEGVEEKEQLDYLESLNCDIYQGYICSKPLPVKDFESFYKDHLIAEHCC